jgi:hypothetical protein
MSRLLMQLIFAPTLAGLCGMFLMVVDTARIVESMALLLPSIVSAAFQITMVTISLALARTLSASAPTIRFCRMERFLRFRITTVMAQ